MKIEEGNANKTTRIDKRFSVTIILTSAIFMISGSAATMSYAATQTLPTCVDPTGQNLPCIMFISILPPPKHTLLCQESSGQIFKCTYIVDKLSNGNKVVSITVYVPANFAVSGTESFRVVKVRVTVSVHTTYSCQKGYHDVIIDGIHECVPNPPEHTPEYLLGQKYGSIDGAVGIYDLAAACSKFTGTDFDHCKAGYYEAFVKTCVHSKFGCDDIVPTPNPVCAKDNMTCPSPKPPFTCNSPGYNGTCPTNMTATTSTPSGTNMTTNMSSTTSKPSVGKGPTCGAGNCTTGTPPPVDCTKNPSDPSCTQTLTPSTTTPTTKTCPDGSVIDASATCPTPSTNPNTSPPPSSSTPPPPPPSNNPSPPSDNGNPSGGSGSSNGGGGSNGNNNNGGGSSSGDGGPSPPNP